MRMGIASGGVGILLCLSASLTAADAFAQNAGAASPPPSPPPSAAIAPPPVHAAGSSAGGAPGGVATGGAAVTGYDTAPAPVPTELLEVEPNGLTAAQAGFRARSTSWNAKAAQETLQGAVAQVEAAWTSFLPRLSGIGKYTRLSNFSPPPLFALPAGTTLPPPFNNLGSVSFFVLDNWLLQGTITVPISDYFLRIEQNYSAATHSRDAARWDVVTARAAADTNGKLAYYTWLNARGAVIVTVQTLNDQKTHLRDARNQFAVGNASKADVLRSETAVASAELALEHARNVMDLAEKQLRVAMHLPEDQPMAIGEDLDSPLPEVQGNLKQMTIEAFASRPEIRSADANAAAAEEQVSVGKAGNWPVLSAFADGIEGNPNPRVIPPSNYWFGTWDVGAQVTWALNDVLVAGDNARNLQSRLGVIEANKNQTRDNIEVEVTQMLEAVREADFSIQSSTRELTSAEEAYRVQRELFNNGRGTSTTLADAEADLTRARLDLLNSKVAARTARIRLEHALGRDAAAAAATAQ